MQWFNGTPLLISNGVVLMSNGVVVMSNGVVLKLYSTNNYWTAISSWEHESYER